VLEPEVVTVFKTRLAFSVSVCRVSCVQLSAAGPIARLFAQEPRHQTQLQSILEPHVRLRERDLARAEGPQH